MPTNPYQPPETTDNPPHVSGRHWIDWKVYLGLAALAWIVGYLAAPAGPVAAPHHLVSAAIVFCALIAVYWWGRRHGRLGNDFK